MRLRWTEYVGGYVEEEMYVNDDCKKRALECVAHVDI
jgi:hypothetical protein